MTSKLIEPYLVFGGRCEEAIEFYQRSIGAKVEMVMLFKDSPEPTPPGMLQEGFEEKVMHCSFRVGETRVMATDGCDEGASFSGFSLSLSVPTEAEANQIFQALAEEGVVGMPLCKTFWSPCFGMLTDRYGLGWMITVPAEM